MDIVFASKNPGKIREVREILEGRRFRVISMLEAGLDIDILEDGGSFEANAVKKAVTVLGLTGLPALGDDSGLEIDYLNGRPGVYSSRFLGEDTPYEEKNQIILDMMKDAGVDQRQARFVCVMALALPSGDIFTARGVLEGVISWTARGSEGFGYDPIFYVKRLGKTLGELSPERKHVLSHRGAALRAMAEQMEARI